MPSKKNVLALSKTLRQVGLQHLDVGKVKWLGFAEADPQQNKKVHRQTNDLLLQLLLAGDMGRCIHVTGEMRALLDPFHRKVCSEMHKRTGRSFSVLYDVPEKQRGNKNAVIGHSLAKWSEKGTKSWEEYLRTFDVIGERAVNVHASNTNNDIQYSIFGHKYILLQGKHRDTAKAKLVWLLESEALNAALCERGQWLIDKATDIDERWYRNFMLSLSGLGARSILTRLADGSAIDPARLLDDKLLQDYDATPSDSAAALETIGFVKTNESGAWTISSRGREYLDLFVPR
jgi:hypothetical protein